MSSYDDLKALIQRAPEAINFTIQGLWNGETAEADKRYIVLIENGGPSDEDIQRSTFNVWFVSRQNDSNLGGFHDDVRAISTHLSRSFKENCAFGIIVNASASSPRPSTDNRFWATMDVQVLYSIRPE